MSRAGPAAAAGAATPFVAAAVPAGAAGAAGPAGSGAGEPAAGGDPGGRGAGVSGRSARFVRTSEGGTPDGRPGSWPHQTRAETIRVKTRVGTPQTRCRPQPSGPG